MAWQPSEQLVRHMVGLLHDISVPDTNRQAQIHSEFLQLQTRTDFALYLMFLTSGCPGMEAQGITINEHGRIAACSRLARVFKDKDSTARTGLDDAAASYIRDECIKYVPITHPTIRNCVIDVLSYLCVYQEFKGWEQIFSTLLQWITGDPAPQTNEHILQQAGIEALYRILDNVTQYDEMTEYFSDSHWRPLFDALFTQIINSILSSNKTVRQLSVRILIDCTPCLPPSIFDKASPLLNKMINNLYLLSTNDADNPKSRQYTMELLATLVTLNIDNVLGFTIKGKTIAEIQLHAHNNPIPTPTPQFDLNTNMFALVDNFLLLAASLMTRTHHTNCSSGYCDPTLDRVANESISFLLSFLSSNATRTGVRDLFCSILMKRHANNFFPALFNCCRYTDCEIAELERVQQQELRQNQIAPHFNGGLQTGGDGGGDDDDDDTIDYDEGADDNDDEGQPETTSTVRGSATIAVSAYIKLCPEEALGNFLPIVDGLLTSQRMTDRELALLLLGFYGSHFQEQLMERLTVFIPQLLTVLSSNDQHPAITTMIAWTIGRLRTIFVQCDLAGMKAHDGRSPIQIFFQQALRILQTPLDGNQEYALLSAITGYFDFDQVYLYCLEFHRDFFQLAITKLQTTQRKTAIVNYTDFLSNLLVNFTDSFSVEIDTAFLIQSVATPFISQLLTIDYAEETLGDWLLALNKLIFVLPIEFLTTATQPIYLRLLQILNQLGPMFLESLDSNQTLADQYDSSLEWHISNTAACVLDCISALAEQLKGTFQVFLLDQPHETLITPLEQCYMRIVIKLYPEIATNSTPEQQQQLMMELKSYGTLPLLLNHLISTLEYNDLSTRQGSFAIIGELVSSSPEHPLLKRFTFFSVQIAETCITVDRSETDLLSNASWFLRMMLENHGEQVLNYGYLAQDKKTQQMVMRYPGQVALHRTLLIALTDANSVREAQGICMVLLRTFARFTAGGLLNCILKNSDNDIKATVTVITKLFDSVKKNCRQGGLDAITTIGDLSTIIPLLATLPNDVAIAPIVSFHNSVLAGIDRGQLLVGGEQIPADVIKLITSNYSALAQANFPVFDASLKQINQESLAVLKQFFGF